MKYLATGGAVAILSLANPIVPHYLIKAYLRKRRFQKARFLADLKRLQKRELIDCRELADGQTKIILKSAGKRFILQYDIDNIKISRPKNWDGKWRLVIFDIPDEKRAARNALVSKLKELGFYMLQKSVYIHPFPCDNEIEFISSVFKIRDNVLALVIEDLEGSKKVLHLFNL